VNRVCTLTVEGVAGKHEVRHFWSCEKCGHEVEMTVNLRINAASKPGLGVERSARVPQAGGKGSLLCSAENPEHSANGQARASSVIGRVPTLPQKAPVRAWQKSEQPLDSLDKHSACHAEGRGFEPRRSRQFSHNTTLSSARRPFRGPEPCVARTHES
jgi:hypothetical protein